jgi:hypothetical protein
MRKESIMKRLFPLLALVLAAPLAGAQQDPASAQEPRPPDEGARAKERQFTGQVITTDVDSKALTVKVSAVDPKGERLEKTLTLKVAEGAMPQLATLQAGDGVTVLWRTDEAQGNVAIALVKAGAGPPDKQ